MAHQKDKHYWYQLRAALTAGSWALSSPGRTPNGSPLPWSELLRKFNKHCRGFSDVAEVASQTQALSVLLNAGSQDEDQSLVERQKYGTLHLGDECRLQEERLGEARDGYEALKKLQGSHLDSLNLALAYYAYALGQTDQCIAYVDRVPDLTNLNARKTAEAGAGSTRSDASALYPPSDISDATSSIRTGSFASLSSQEPAVDIENGKAWTIIETIRSICLKGMAQEILSPGDVNVALKTYCSAIAILGNIEAEISVPTAPVLSTGKLDFVSFARYRELWRWVERLLWRAIILAAKRSHTAQYMGEEDPLWSLLAHYRITSLRWPSTFRWEHRSTIAVLHIRALVIRARITASPLDEPVSFDPEKPPQWLGTARSVIQEYRVVLNANTRFPKAGERNVQVEEFVDLCVAVWEASGCVGDWAGWVIDILWWAARLTFNSHRVFRHMTRLFYAGGDPVIAQRTLRLYVQVVGKAYEADVVQTDSDANWVQTLVDGARMLCRTGGVKEAQEAGRMIEKAKARLDLNNKDLVARVQLAEGIYNFVMAHKEDDPRTRPNRLSDALDCLNQSLRSKETAACHYQLALVLSQDNLDEAIMHATAAIEGMPREIRSWHLLGLLLNAAEQWKAAKGVLDHGALIGAGSNEEVDGSTINAEDDATPTAETPKAIDHAQPNGRPVVNGMSHHPSNLPGLLESGGNSISAAEDLLGSLGDHPTLSRRDTLEQALQLRMTQVALSECVDGPEMAGDKWVDVFAWVAEKRGLERTSLDAGRRSGETIPPSMLGDKAETNTIHAQSIEHRQVQTKMSAEIHRPPPITITPASPNEKNPNEMCSDSTLQQQGAPQQEFGFDEKRMSLDRSKSTGKKMQMMLKNRVHKGQEKISTISKKIGHGVTRNGARRSLRRTISAPDFHLDGHGQEGSSIHSRRRLRSLIRQRPISPPDSPPPPPPPLIRTPSPVKRMTKRHSNRLARENRLLSDLWLMSAATFRRLGKVEQAKGAIQEAEVKDENNPGVWVQLGLYHMAHGRNQQAIEAFHKALFISLDDVPATIHLCRLYLSPLPPLPAHADPDPDNVALAAGMLEVLTRGKGWNVPEAWAFLARAYALQGRPHRERECREYALRLAEKRGVREISAAVGLCL